MLSKVFKYDMKAMNRSLIPGYIIILLLALLTKGLSLLAAKVTLFRTIAAFSTVLFIVAIIGLFFYTFVVSIMRFYKNLIKEEGYLTHTLPVKKSTIILSKLLSANVHYFLTFLVVFIAVMINIYDATFLKSMLDLIYQGITYMGLTVPFTLTYVIFYLILTAVYNTLFIYVSICLGQTRNDKKLMYSVIYGVIVYMVGQLVATAQLGILFLFNSELRTITNDVAPTTETFIQVLTTSAVVSILMMIAYYVISVKILDRKLNLE